MTMTTTTTPAAPTTTAPTAAPTTAAPVRVEGITLSTYAVSLTVGQSKMPIVTMTPENAADKGEIWTSSDTGVAAVSSLGNITGIAAGSCTVTVTSRDNPAVSAVVEVTVTRSVRDEQDRQAREIAQQIADSIGPGTDLERVGQAAQIVSGYYQRGIHKESGDNYYRPYGVFIAGESSWRRNHARTWPGARVHGLFLGARQRKPVGSSVVPADDGRPNRLG